ncbi:MAG: hypothetical protein WAN04_07875 [Candidatus Udaeobacter sp.]
MISLASFACFAGDERKIFANLRAIAAEGDVDVRIAYEGRVVRLKERWLGQPRKLSGLGSRHSLDVGNDRDAGNPA